MSTSNIQIVVLQPKSQSTEAYEVLSGAGARGQTLKIKVKALSRYQLKDLSQQDQAAPELVNAKRVGKNLEIKFEDGDGPPDLVLENFYDSDPVEAPALVGEAENGFLYEYVVEAARAETSLSTLIAEQGRVYAVLGGSEVVVSSGAALGALAFNPLLAGLGAGGAAAAGGGGGGGGGGVVPDANATVTINNISLDTGTNSNDFVTSDRSLIVNGTTTNFSSASAGSQVSVQLLNSTGTTVVFSTVVLPAADGSWNWDLTGISLADGTYQIRADIVDSSGNIVSTGTVRTLTIDATAPTTTVDITAISQDSGLSTSDFITNDNNGLTISATLSAALGAGEALFYSRDNGATWTDITASVSGTTVSHADSGLTQTSTIQMQVRDTAGNAGATDSQLVTIDTAAPTTSVDITAISQDTGVNANDFITSDNDGLTISATLSAALGAGEALFYSRDNGATWSNITASVSGTSVSHTDSGLTQTSTIQVQVRDTAGNVAATDSQLVTIVGTGPTTTVDITAISQDTGVSANDFITSDNDGLTISATLSAALGTGEALFYSRDNGTTWTDITASVSGTVISHADSGLTQTSTIQMRVQDTAGNAGAADSQLVTISTTAPATAVDITAITQDTGVSTSDFITNDNNGLTISATLSTALATGEALFYSRDNGVTWIDITASVSGTTVSHADNSLTQTSTIQMQVRDTAGNPGATDSQVVTIDTSGGTTQPNNAVDPNTTATVTIAAISTDSGTSTSDFITNDQTLVYSGTVINFTANGAAVELVLTNASSVEVGRTYVTPAANGTWSWDNTGVTRASGSYTLTATVVDEAGNRTNTTAAGTDSQVVTIDTSGGTTQPDNAVDPNTTATVTIAAISTDSGTSTSDFITNDQTLVYSGTVINFTANGAAVELVLTNASSVEVGRTYVTPAANGSWSWDNTGVSRASGNYTLTATVVDAAGNRTNTAAAGQDSQVVTIDTSGGTTQPDGQTDPNTTATVSITAISADSGTSTNDFITNDQTLSYSGTVSNFTANGAAVELVLTNASSVEVGRTFVTPAANGAWSWDNTGVSRTSGSYTLTATVVDAAGNRTNTAAAGQDTQVLTIDTSAPIPVVNPDDPLNPPAGKASLVLDSVTADNVLNSAESGLSAVPVTGTVRGDFTTGDVVTLVINDKNFTGSVNTQGVFSIDVSGADLLADADKTIAASVLATDWAGNQGPVTASHVYSTDSTAPTTTVEITAISQDTGVSTSDFITNDNNGLTISATLSAGLATGEALFYSKDNGTTWTDITASVSGTAVSHADSSLTQTSTIQMRVQDTAGNPGATDSQLVTIDTTGPAPVVDPEDPLNPPAGKASLVLDSVTADNVLNSAESGLSAVPVTGTVRGDFTTGDVVTLVINDKNFTGSVNTQGVFSIDVPGADLLADADKTIAASVLATDRAGNQGPVTASHVYSTDSTAPTTTVDITAISLDSGASNSDFITNDNNGLTISATLSTALASGEALFYSKDNGTTWTDITASVSGTAVSHVDSSLTQTSTIQMQVRDAAGNPGASDSQLVTIDTTAPIPVVNPDDPLNPPAGKASLVLDSVTADNVLNAAEGAQANVAITGTVRGDFTTGDVVTLVINDKNFTGSVNTQGVFSIDVPGADLLADSDKTIAASVLVTDRAGNQGAVTASHVYSTDSTAPTTTVDITAISDDTGVSTSDFITNDNNGLAISASLSTALASGEALFYSKDNGATWTDITASVSGTAVSHADSSLTQTSTIQMQVRDTAGNPGATDSQLVTIDTTGPAPVVDPEDPLNPPAGKASLVLDNITADNVINAAEGAQANVAITGTARGEFRTGDAVTLTVNGKPFGGSVATNGTFSINVPGSDLRDASTKTVSATLAATDAAGNLGSITDTQDYTVNTTAPTTTVDITAISQDTGVSTSDFITNDNNGLTISATLSAALVGGERLFYSKDNGATWTDITASVNGTAVNHADNSLTQTSTIQMQVRDTAGNPGATDSQVVTIDTSGGTTQPDNAVDPNTTATVTIAAISTDSGTSTSDFITNDQTLVYSGTVINFTANGAAVELVLTNASSVEVGRTYVTPAANGTWSWDNTGVTRASGSYTLTATVVDEAGNRTNTTAAGTDSQVVTIDTSGGTTQPDNAVDPNTTATVTIAAISTDSGTSTSDFITNDQTLVYSGTVINFTANGAAVELVLTNASSVEVGRTYVTPAANGSWSWDNTGVSRASGNYTLTATVVDAAGNRTNTAAAGQDSQVVTIDTTAPTTTVNITAISHDSGSPSNDFITNDNDGLTISATLSESLGADEQLFYSRDNGTTWTDITASVSGTAVSHLDNGLTQTSTIQMRVQDAAGNLGAADSQLVTIDITPPTTTVDITAISQDTGVSSTDFITNENNGLTISATLSAALGAGEFLTYSSNGVNWTNITSSVSGTTVTHVDNSLTQTSTIRMRVIDIAGNPGTLDSQLVTIDTMGPIPVTDPENPLNPPAGRTSLVLDRVTADNVLNSAEASLSAVAITGRVRGDFTTGDVVTLFINGKNFTGSVNTQGVFSIDVPGADLLADENLSIEAYVLATDAAGNQGTIDSSHGYSVDTTGPTTTVDITAITQDTGVSASDFITSDNNGLTISAILSAPLAAGEFLTYSNNGVNWTNITSSVSGTAVSHVDSSLTQTRTIRMRVIDLAGNPGTLDSQLVTIDSTVPTGITVSVDNVTADNIVNAAEAAGNLTLTGKVTGANVRSGDTVTLTINNNIYTGTVGADGTTYTVANVSGADLKDDAGKTISASFTATTLAGGSATFVGSKTYTVDTTPTDPVNASRLFINKDTGADFNDWNVFTDSSSKGFTIFAELPAGSELAAKIQMQTGGGSWVDGVLVPSTQGNGRLASFQIPDVLPSGTTTFKFRTIDGVDNVSAETSKDLVVTALSASNTVAASQSSFVNGQTYMGTNADQTFTLDNSTVLNYLGDAFSNTNNIHGGGGVDTLKLTDAGTTLNLTKLTTFYNNLKLQGFEIIDMEGGDAQSTIGDSIAWSSTLSAAWLNNAALKPGYYQGVVRGDANDTLTLTQGDAFDTTPWAKSTSKVFSGIAGDMRQYDVWTNDALKVQLLVGELVIIQNLFVSIDNISTDTGSNNADFLTTDSTVVLSGSSSGVSVDGKVRIVVTRTADATSLFSQDVPVDAWGRWTIDRSAFPIDLGTYSFAAMIVDSTGNVLFTQNVNSLSKRLVITEPTATNDATTATEDSASAVTGNLLGNDTSGDGATLKVQNAKGTAAIATTVAASGTTPIAGKYGTLVLAADGSYSYNLDNTNATVNALNAGQSLADETFSYTLTNGAAAGHGLVTKTATLTVTVNGANDAPVVAVALADVSVVNGVAFSQTVPASSFTDVDNAALTYTATLASGAALPAWLTFNSATRTFSGTAPTSATTVVRVTASDGSLSVSDDFNIVSSAPPTISINSASAVEGAQDKFQGLSDSPWLDGVSTQLWNITSTDKVFTSSSNSGFGTNWGMSGGYLGMGQSDQGAIDTYTFRLLGGGSFSSISFLTARGDAVKSPSANMAIQFFDSANTFLGQHNYNYASVSQYGQFTVTTPTIGTGNATSFRIVSSVNNNGISVDNLTYTTNASSTPYTTGHTGTLLDNTPRLNGSISRPLLAGESVEILRGGLVLGTATTMVGSSNWTFTDPNAGFTTHTYTARLKSGATVISTSSVFSLTIAATPLALDLNGDGIQTTSIHEGTQFDLLDTGKKQNVGWVSKEDGLLAMDLDGDGLINSGAELFGDRTVLADGSRALDGWAALRAMDSNHDGVMDANDADFNQLLVWVDANGNGVSDAGELRSLADHNIVSIDLNADQTVVEQNGNVVQAFSTYTTTDGVTHEVADVGFAVDASLGVFKLNNGESFDLSQLSSTSKAHIDMATDALANTLKISLSDVLKLDAVNGVHQLMVTADDNDAILMAFSEWTQTGNTVLEGGREYFVYNAVNDQVAAQLLIDQNVVNAGRWV
jgi:large repetitive protein